MVHSVNSETKEDPLARNQHIVTRRKEIGKVDTKQRKQGTLHSEMLFVSNHIFDYFYVFGIAALPETKCCQPVSSLQIQAFLILYFFIECSQALTPFATIIITWCWSTWRCQCFIPVSFLLPATVLYQTGRCTCFHCWAWDDFFEGYTCKTFSMLIGWEHIN